MSELTLVIPARNESESLPDVLDEIKELDHKIIVSLHKDDILDTLHPIMFSYAETICLNILLEYKLYTP